MGIYLSITILICLSSLFAYVNQRFFKFPFIIGIFFLATLLSVLIIGSKFLFNFPIEPLRVFIKSIQIDKIILNYFLGFLLFAGAFHTNWNHLKEQIKPIAVFSIPGVLLSTLIVALLFWGLTQIFKVQISFLYCLLFGALISPTDPIAVLALLTKAHIPKKTEYIIVGESLFNDGIGVVVFISLLDTLNQGSFSISHFGFLFLQEALGGIFLGLFLGYSLYFLLKSIDHYETEILLTLTFVMAGYTFCNYLKVSGALAMVVMGLMAGRFREKNAISHTTKDYMLKLWELVDLILNAVLFILIALILIEIDFRTNYIIIGLLSVLIVLVSRIFVVFFPQIIYPSFLNLSHKEAFLISWGGLRGGLSLALVLSLPESESQKLLVISTYFSVLFSIIIQGLTIEKLAKVKTN